MKEEKGKDDNTPLHARKVSRRFSIDLTPVDESYGNKLRFSPLHIAAVAVFDDYCEVQLTTGNEYAVKENEEEIEQQFEEIAGQ